MGTYSQLSTEEIKAARRKYSDALIACLTAPSSASSGARSVQFNRRVDDIRREIAEIDIELAERDGKLTRGPIYVVP